MATSLRSDVPRTCRRATRQLSRLSGCRIVIGIPALVSPTAAGEPGRRAASSLFVGQRPARQAIPGGKRLMLRSLAGALMAVLALPPILSGQEVPRWPVAIEPFAGIIDDAYDVGDDGSTLGMLVGARVSLRPTAPLRVTFTAGYGRTPDVGYHSPAVTVAGRNDWLLAALGVEHEGRRGPVGIAAGVELGAAWRRIAPEGPVSDPVDAERFSGGWSPTEALIPSVAVRYPVGKRLAASIGGRLHLYHFLENARSSPAVTLGLVMH